MDTVKNAIIERAIITSEDHGVLSAWLFLDYGGSGQGFGGHALYLPEARAESGAGHFIWSVMQIAGVTKWEDLKGKPIRVKIFNDKIEAIGHFINDDWFRPGDTTWI